MTNCSDDCWHFRTNFSGVNYSHMGVTNKSGFIPCRYFELEDPGLCAEDDAWSVNRTQCKAKCASLVGCQSFTYSQVNETCFLNRHNNNTKEIEVNEGFESWTTECTTTTFCPLCAWSCEHAELLDLRFIAWSNLGCMGPNKTITYQGIEHALPCDIRYYNVLNSTNASEVTYLSVTNVSEYLPGDALLNGVGYEPAEEAALRGESPIAGAYGQINMRVGTSTDFKFTFLDVRSQERT